MKILLTICARSGSKGLKNKNVRLLNGKPLISHTISHGLKWGRAANIIVSTDSKAIADIAKQSGAEIPFLRPAELSQDNTPKIAVIRHALFACEKKYSETYDMVVDLDVTAPLRRISDIENCYQKFLDQKPLTLFSVVPAHRNPYFNMVEILPDGRARLCKDPNGLPIPGRQSAPLVYDMNASIYFYSRRFLLNRENTTPHSEHTVAYVMEEWSRYDIDREIDFKYVEFLLNEGCINEAEFV